MAKPFAPWRQRATELGLDDLPIFRLRRKVQSLSGRTTTINDPDKLKRRIVTLTDAGSTSPTGAGSGAEQPASTHAGVVPAPPCGDGANAAQTLEDTASGEPASQGVSIIATDDAREGTRQVEPSPAVSPGSTLVGDAVGGGARIVLGMSNSEYHSNRRRSSTHVRKALASIADLMAYDDADHEERRNLRIGHGVHAIFTEPDTVTVDECPPGVVDDESIKALREALDGIEDPETGKPASKGGGTAEHVERVRRLRPELVLLSDLRAGWEASGRLVLNRADFDLVQACADAVRRNPDAMHLIESSGAGREVVFEWTERIDVDGNLVEIECQSKHDLLPGWERRASEPLVLTDLKTLAGRPTTRDVGKSVRKYGYDVQLAFNGRAVERNGLRVATSMDIGKMRDGVPWLVSGFLIAVSTTAPHWCEVIPIGSRMFARAQERVDEGLRRMARHMLHPDTWPGYSAPHPDDHTRPAMQDPVDDYEWRD